MFSEAATISIVAAMPLSTETVAPTIPACIGSPASARSRVSFEYPSISVFNCTHRRSLRSAGVKPDSIAAFTEAVTGSEGVTGSVHGAGTLPRSIERGQGAGGALLAARESRRRRLAMSDRRPDQRGG